MPLPPSKNKFKETGERAKEKGQRRKGIEKLFPLNFFLINEIGTDTEKDIAAVER